MSESAAPADTAALEPALRQRMTATYRRVLPVARQAFVQDGEINLSGVPRWVVRAWVLATATGADPVTACIDAHLGAGAVAQLRDKPGWSGWAMGRCWARRLADVEAETAARP